MSRVSASEFVLVRHETRSMFRFRGPMATTLSGLLKFLQNSDGHGTRDVHSAISGVEYG